MYGLPFHCGSSAAVGFDAGGGDEDDGGAGVLGRVPVLTPAEGSTAAWLSLGAGSTGSDVDSVSDSWSWLGVELRIFFLSRTASTLTSIGAL